MSGWVTKKVRDLKVGDCFRWQVSTHHYTGAAQYAFFSADRIEEEKGGLLNIVSGKYERHFRKNKTVEVYVEKESI